MNCIQVLAKCQSGMIPHARNDMDFCLPPFLEVERCHYLLNEDELADKSLAESLLVSNSTSYKVS
jgi:hypothetical protein